MTASLTRPMHTLAARDWTWPALAILICAAMLAIAHASQVWGGLAPCALCLRQREVYWSIIGVALGGLLLHGLRPDGRRALALHVLLGLGFLTGALVAAYHAGGEWGIFTLPQECSGGGSSALPTGNLLDSLNSGPKTVISCQDAAFRLAGLSMAGWNALAALALAVISFAGAGAVYRRHAHPTHG